MSSQTKQNYKSYQVPRKYYEILERKAQELRRKTGNNVIWTDVLKQIIEKELQNELPQS